MLQSRPIHSFSICLGFLISIYLLLSCGSDKENKESREEDPETAELVGTAEKKDESQETKEKDGTQNKSRETIDDDAVLVFDSSQALMSTNGVFAIKVLWLKGPVTDYDNVVELTFARGDLFAVESVEIIRFRTWMEIHGHGGDDRKVVIERDNQYPHVFHIRNFFPIMAGPWSLRITAAIDGVEDNIDIGFKI